MQALVWLCMFWFRAIQFGGVQFSGWYLHLRLHIFKCQISGKTLVLYLSKYGTLVKQRRSKLHFHTTSLCNLHSIFTVIFGSVGLNSPKHVAYCILPSVANLPRGLSIPALANCGVFSHKSCDWKINIALKKSILPHQSLTICN